MESPCSFHRFGYMKPLFLFKGCFRFRKLYLLIFVCTSIFDCVQAQEAADLAKELANPVSSLISAPLQNNMDFGIGEYDGSRYTLNIQPVAPFKLNDKFNLITRLILPLISQSNITGPGETQTGLSDALFSAFFSPNETKSGLIWGAGPALLLPIGKEGFSIEQLGVGPTAVLLKQQNGFTYGALVNQVWGVGGSDDPDFSQLFLQPFLAYNWPTGAGAGANFELTQNWSLDQTTLWFNPFINGVTSLGKQKVQLSVGPRFNLAAPSGGRADWGLRTVIIFLFPK